MRNPLDYITTAELGTIIDRLHAKGALHGRIARRVVLAGDLGPEARMAHYEESAAINRARAAEYQAYLDAAAVTIEGRGAGG